ncbi:MAG: hypothetical protein ACI81T_002892 [Bacteroidia bacterium]
MICKLIFCDVRSGFYKKTQYITIFKIRQLKQTAIAFYSNVVPFLVNIIIHSMSEFIFHNKPFVIDGMEIPEFELRKGEMIQIYIPNFSLENKSIGHNLALQLAKYFNTKNSNLPFADYKPAKWQEFLFPLTVRNYLMNVMEIDLQPATQIAEECKISLDSTFMSIVHWDRKKLVVKALFEIHSTIVFDYYGIPYGKEAELTCLVKSELDKGKSAIAFDNLQYAFAKKPYNCFKPVYIKNGLWLGFPLPLS